ncbi:MAG: protein kinase [Candidatus Berkiella sp.]
MNPGPEKKAKTKTKIQGQYGQYTLLPAELLPKEVAGPTAFLGKGAFGTVSIAFNQDGVPLAVKTLTLDKSSSEYPKLIDEIKKEIRVMKHLERNADFIIQESPDSNKVQVYVIQPYIRGMEVEKYFKELDQRAKELPPDDVKGQLLILKDAMNCWIACLEATKELHKKRVIHGDLHNGNLLYDPSNIQATLIDFGMSHILQADEEAVYVEEEAIISNYHRAPETRLLAARRAGHPPERKYDVSTDAYSLAIDFGVTSEFTEKYAPDFAGREVAQIMKLFKELSQEPILGGNDKPTDRLSLNQAIERLSAIRAQLDIRLIQKSLFAIPEQEIKDIARKHAEANNLNRQILEHQLPVNIKAEIKQLAKKIKARQLQLLRDHQDLSAEKSAVSNAFRPQAILPSEMARRDPSSKRGRPQSGEPPSPTSEPETTRQKGSDSPKI